MQPMGCAFDIFASMALRGLLANSPKCIIVRFITELCWNYEQLMKGRSQSCCSWTCL